MTDSNSNEADTSKRFLFGNPAFFLAIAVVCFPVGTYALQIQSAPARLIGLLCLLLAGVSPVAGIVTALLRWKHLKVGAKIATALLLVVAALMAAMLVPAL